MSKLWRYALFQELDNCYQCTYDISSIDLWISTDRDIILELGCGSGAYVIELAKLYPDKVIVWVDMRSDRLCFWAKDSKDLWLDNTKFVWAQVDHLERFIKDNTAEEIWITFPDPWSRRDRQKLTSPKYLTIYKKILIHWWVINIKTDSRDFYDFSLDSLTKDNFEICENTRDIYKLSNLSDILNIKTYYEKKWLKEWRQIWYIKSAYKADNDN